MISNQSDLWRLKHIFFYIGSFAIVEHCWYCFYSTKQESVWYKKNFYIKSFCYFGKKKKKSNVDVRLRKNTSPKMCIKHKRGRSAISTDSLKTLKMWMLQWLIDTFLKLQYNIYVLFSIKNFQFLVKWAWQKTYLLS